VIKSHHLTLAGMTTALALATPAAAESLLLDGFTDLDDISPVLAGETDTYVLTDSDLPDGTTTEVSVTGVAGTSFSGGTPAEDFAIFSTTADPGNPGLTSLTYDLSSPVDFSLVDALSFDLDVVDAIDISTDLTLTDSEGDESSFSGGYMGNDSEVVFLIEDFASDAGYDSDSVSSISLAIGSEVGDDFRLDDFSANVVPSPTAAGAGILGLIAFGLRRRGRS